MVRAVGPSEGEKKPLIFVTADAKEDWWTKEGRPRPELIHEMFMEAQATFHIYKPAQFVTNANKFLDLRKEAKSVEKAATELKEIESQRQSSRETSAVLADFLRAAETNSIGSRSILEMLNATKPDASASAAFASLANLSKPDNSVAAYIAALTRPDPSAFAARLIEPRSLLSAQIEQMNRSNATVSAYLESLTKPGPALSAQLEEMKRSNASLSAYLERLTKPDEPDGILKTTSGGPAKPFDLNEASLTAADSTTMSSAATRSETKSTPSPDEAEGGSEGDAKK